MTDPDINESPNPKGLAASIAGEALKLLNKIVDLWKIALKDDDRTIRLFALMATVSAFLLTFVIIVLCCDMAVSSGGGSPVDFQWYVVAGCIVVAPVFLLAFPAAWRKSEQVNVGILEAGFQNVYNSRYGTRVQ